ncbi:hypothetical protein V8F20_006954 [Naviculisporaceae sp. PSN 640]
MEMTHNNIYDDGTTHYLWLEMQPPRYNNLGQPLWGTSDDPPPWVAFIMVQFNAINLERIMQKDGLFWKHPAQHIVEAVVTNDNMVEAKDSSLLKLTGTARKDKYFKWELVRSWKIREFPEKPATQSRWSGQILLCESLVRWHMRNSSGTVVLHCAPSTINFAGLETHNFSDMNERSPEESLLWIWPGRGRIRTSDVASLGGGGSLMEGGQSSKNNGVRGRGVDAGGKGMYTHGGGRSDVPLPCCRHWGCNKSPPPPWWKDVLMALIASQDFWMALVLLALFATFCTLALGGTLIANFSNR